MSSVVFIGIWAVPGLNSWNCGEDFETAFLLIMQADERKLFDILGTKCMSRQELDK